ncbi:hypothetical protein [Streptomyces yerevanensis]|uniref:hypothetical protein n=1 Tax=Streptomyces yerevanensis TaxID=66378 RepID=UPI0012FE8940|nr:hypothetical protein [Streptomyces yerevanensis]
MAAYTVVGGDRACAGGVLTATPRTGRWLPTSPPADRIGRHHRLDPVPHRISDQQPTGTSGRLTSPSKRHVLVSTSLTHAETGLNDYFNSPDWEPTQDQPEEELGTDDGDASDEDDLGWDLEDDGDEREENWEETASGDDDPDGNPVVPATTDTADADKSSAQLRRRVGTREGSRRVDLVDGLPGGRSALVR